MNPPHDRTEPELTAMQMAGALGGALVAIIIATTLLVYFFPEQAQAIIDSAAALGQWFNQIVLDRLASIIGELPGVNIQGESQEPDLFEPESWDASREPGAWDHNPSTLESLSLMLALSVLWILIGIGGGYLDEKYDVEERERRP